MDGERSRKTEMASGRRNQKETTPCEVETARYDQCEEKTDLDGW